MHRELPELMFQARTALADFLGCKAQDVVYVTNSTFGTNVAAHALGQRLQPGDEILVSDHEYGACIRAWHTHAVRHGAVIVTADIPMPVPSFDSLVDRIWSKVTDRTRILFLSHITSPTAITLPIAELVRRARERGIISVIDGSHVPGHIPLHLDELGADIYTGNLHKWMCTPKGSAFLHVRRELQDAIGPLVVSWGPLSQALHHSEFMDEHEYLGTRDPAPFLPVPYAIEWMQGNDWSAIQERSKALVRWGIDQLTMIPGIRAMHAERSDECLQMGAVLLPHGANVDDLKRKLYDEYAIEVVVHAWLQTPILRFSVHAHTTQEDIAALVSAIRDSFLP
jgi:isopenicillin-N epimerase